MRGVGYDVDDCVHRILIAKSDTVCNGLSSTTSDLEGICCDVEAVQQCDDFSGLTKRESNSTAPISLCRWFLSMPPLVSAGVEKEMSRSTGEAQGLGMKDTVRAILSAPRRTYMRAAPHRSKDAVSLDSLSNGVDSLSEKNRRYDGWFFYLPDQSGNPPSLLTINQRSVDCRNGYRYGGVVTSSR